MLVRLRPDVQDLDDAIVAAEALGLADEAPPVRRQVQRVRVAVVVGEDLVLAAVRLDLGDVAVGLGEADVAPAGRPPVGPDRVDALEREVGDLARRASPGGGCRTTRGAVRSDTTC
jgi:hypothetical protein